MNMRVLIVHNDYGKYSGEEAVVDKMAAMLRSHGHEVVFYRLTSEGSRESFMGRVHGFVAGVYSPRGVRGMREALRRERPDVVNVHNLYPFISPAALRECRKAAVPVVMTVHNFRLICPTGLFMRDGQPCELCLRRGNEWGCVRYNCEHSLLKSAGYALRNAVARITGAYRRNVSAYACITDFQRRKLAEAGFPVDRLCVIPNFMDSVQTEVAPVGNYVAYCGRLSREKGIDMIIEVARRHPEITFKLAGEVRDKELTVDVPANCQLMGYLSGADLENFYRRAAFFVMASRWYEGFPMSILEAAQYGKPTIGPDHGGFSEIIGRDDATIGRLFSPGDTDELERRVVELWNDRPTVAELGRRAHDKLRRCYSSEAVYGQWERLFEKVITNK